MLLLLIVVFQAIFVTQLVCIQFRKGSGTIFPKVFLRQDPKFGGEGGPTIACNILEPYFSSLVQQFIDVLDENSTLPSCNELCKGKLEKLNSKGNEVVQAIVKDMKNKGTKLLTLLSAGKLIKTGRLYFQISSLIQWSHKLSPLIG